MTVLNLSNKRNDWLRPNQVCNRGLPIVSPSMDASESLAMNSTIDKMSALDVSDDADHVKLAANMVSRCSLLLTELEEFQFYLKEKKKDNVVDIKGFKNDLESELKRIKNVSNPTAFI